MTDQEFVGLFGEVVTEDVYGIKQLDFVPDIIIDVGANVGIFSQFAKELFPSARIIAIEPDETNLIALSKIEGIDVLDMSIGVGQIYRAVGAVNGAHECYYSAGYQFSNEQLETSSKWIKFDTKPIMLSNRIITDTLINPGLKSIIKIDIEGAEDIIFGDKASMDILRSSDYIAIELHDAKRQSIFLFLELCATHRCVFEKQIFKARKK